MIKTKTVFQCRECGTTFPKWLGQCLECSGWNTIDETILQMQSTHIARKGYAGEQSEVMTLNEVPQAEVARIPSGFSELDRVLGGGLVIGSVVLIGGDPGIGKSTLLLQTLCQLSAVHKALYITGEESLQQVSLRASRLKLSANDLLLLAETQVEQIIAHAKKHKPQVMVIDSIQTVFTEILSAAPGAVSQVRESAAQLVRFAKLTHTILFLVGHVTKEGMIAGPRVLEHMVDTVLYFEGDGTSRFRVIRAIKNRFGAVNELGIFAMSEMGLKTVSNPSAIFLSQRYASIPGSSIMVTWEGSRPMLIEVQALVDESHLSNPRRVTLGFDHNRLAMLLAVLHRHAGIITFDQDVFINVVGGVRVTETAIDLALLFAVVSSLRDRVLPQDLVIFGEVGLAGELRPVQSGMIRLVEAQKHGFKRAIIPRGNKPKQIIENFEVLVAEDLQSALNLINDL
jgi:DNA repair protein RadA/Sms